MTISLSKSKILASLQCPKRVWLEVHRKDLRVDSSLAQAAFDTGNKVGAVARMIYDPKKTGVLIEIDKLGFQAAFEKTATLLKTKQPIFEAGFRTRHALAFADVMLPVYGGWRMVEVKASSEVTDVHRDDIAVQAWVARQAGVKLKNASLAIIDKQWIYTKTDNYLGLFKEEDFTDEVDERENEVADWVAQAQKTIAKKKEPARSTGGHCLKPYKCGFLPYCQSQEPKIRFPITLIPNANTKALKSHLARDDVKSLRDVPDDLLTPIQLRVKTQSLKGKEYLDAKGAKAALAPYKGTLLFLDFETAMFAVPEWLGATPYDQVPFQFSLHILQPNGKLTHTGYLDLSGKDPRQAFAKALIKECAEPGPIFVYNKTMEATRVKELAAIFPQMSTKLLAIEKRMVDLWPIAKTHYYHPDMEGSWNLKGLLEAIAPELNYDNLDGVKNGGMAMEAYVIATNPNTSQEDRDRIGRELKLYCERDTLAMVKVWQKFAGRRTQP